MIRAPAAKVAMAIGNQKVVQRFLSVDPLTKDYPELTPYQFASNRPIDGIDLDGHEYSPKRDEVYDYWKTEVKVNNDKTLVNSIGIMGKTEVMDIGYAVGIVKENEWSNYLSKNYEKIDYAQKDVAYGTFSAIKIGAVAGITYASGGSSGLFFGRNAFKIGLISGGIEGLYQFETNDRDISRLNLTAIGMNYYLKNPVVGGLIGDLGKFTLGLGYSGFGSKTFGLTIDKAFTNATGNYLGGKWKIGDAMNWNFGKYLDEGMQGMLGNMTTDAINSATEDSCDESCNNEIKSEKK